MYKKLGEISNPKQWKTLSSALLKDSGYPVYGANGVIGYYDDYNHENETLLVTCRGATCGSLSICETKSYVNGNAMAIDDLDSSVNIYYLYYYLLHRGFNDVISGSAQPQIIRSDIEKIDINIIPLEKQIQIVTILDKIKLLIDEKQRQLLLLDNLVKARFVEMFGDPVANEKSWDTKPLLSMGDCKNGMNFHYSDSGVDLNCLGVGAFKDYSIIDDTTTLPIVSLNEMPSSEYLLKDDDIVFVRSNGNKKMVGRSVAVYPGSVPTTFSGFCIRYRRNDDTVITPYLLRVLKADSMRQKMYGRGANIQNLNQQILASLDIPVPPKELQIKFATFVTQIDKSKFNNVLK